MCRSLLHPVVFTLVEFPSKGHRVSDDARSRRTTGAHQGRTNGGVFLRQITVELPTENGVENYMRGVGKSGKCEPCVDTVG